MKKILVSGTFDPPTLGHLSVIKKCSEIFDETVVCIFVNAEKIPMFSEDARKEMLCKMCENIPGVKIDSYNGMLADYAAANGINYVARGIRNSKDAEYELYMARKNKEYNPQLSTVFFPSDKELESLSSTFIRENIDKIDLLRENLSKEVADIIIKLRKEG